MEGTELYHEKQSMQLCALHCVNNLLQEKAFKKKDFDTIAYELTPGWFRNPHKSHFGTGNYDVNIIMRALKNKGYTVKWFDKRKSIDTDIDFDALFGLIVNENKTGLFSKIWASRHWIAYPRIDGTFYNANSNCAKPKPFESLEDLKENLKKLMEGENNQNQLLLVFKDPPS